RTLHKEHDFTAFQFNELDNARLKEGEQDELESEEEMLDNATEIKNALQLTLRRLEMEETGALDALKEGSDSLNKIKGFYAAVSELAIRLESVHLELKDIARELQIADEKVTHEPDRLQYVKQRLDLLHTLVKKNAASNAQQLIKIREELRAKLAKLENCEIELSDLQREVNEKRVHLNALAQELSARRGEVVRNFAHEVVSQLSYLGMANARFEVEMSPLADYGPTGKDKALFLFNANRAGNLEPIGRVASGGEKSRFMLSLKSVIAKYLQLPTIIFDEIDTGVSGEIAQKTGKLIAAMATYMQVINITHLPQVAGLGQHHYKVFKHDVDGHTETSVKLLTLEERRHEIAKMLSGSEVTEAALRNADELLEK
ncbi:MAG: DNA repair protein RecN, partial [Bacteroidales bacterium]|nr:DNA repair protein RecN [Bacteroidales bacterium]